MCSVDLRPFAFGAENFRSFNAQSFKNGSAAKTQINHLKTQSDHLKTQSDHYNLKRTLNESFKNATV